MYLICGIHMFSKQYSSLCRWSGSNFQIGKRITDCEKNGFKNSTSTQNLNGGNHRTLETWQRQKKTLHPLWNLWNNISEFKKNMNSWTSDIWQNEHNRERNVGRQNTAQAKLVICNIKCNAQLWKWDLGFENETTNVSKQNKWNC